MNKASEFLSRGWTAFLLTSLFLLAPATLQGSPIDRYIQYRIDVNNGLPCSFVDDVLVDSDGFLWIATSGGGLCRYDGYDLITFNTFSQTPLKSNFVRCLAEDRFHRLWIASEGGIDVLDLKTLKPAFDHCPFPLSAESPLCSHITIDAQGAVWTKNGHTLYRLTLDDEGRPEQIRSLSHKSFNVVNIVFKDVDEDGSVWIEMDNRLHCVAPDTDGKSLKAIPAIPSLVFPENTYISDFDNSDGTLWISTEHGLYRLERDSGAWKRYTSSASPNSLTQDFVTSLSRTADGALIASTLRGLNAYMPVTDNFTRIGTDIVNCAKPHNDSFLVATENRGLIVYSPARIAITNVSHIDGVPASLAPGAVNAIHQEQSGRLWVGSVEGGLSIRDNGKTEFRHLTREADGLCHNSVSVLSEDDRGNMYVGTWGGGIDRLTRGTRPYIAEHLPRNADASVDFIGAMEYDAANGLLWIGSNQGIYSWDPTKRRYERMTDTPATGCLGSLIDSSGHLWMGCTEGLYVFDLSKTGTDGRFPCVHYRETWGGEFPIKLEKICCMMEYCDSVFYLGSNGGGLIRAARQKDGSLRFTQLTSAQGLSSDSVRGLCKDENGNIWASTENGLNHLDVTSGKISTFSREDGLASSRFHWNNACHGTDGELYFGHENGFSQLSSSRIPQRAKPLSMRFAGISYSGHTDFNPFPERMDLHEKDRDIRLRFSALDADVRSSVTYLYKMEGFDREWLKLKEGEREAVYSSLPGKNYIFRVKAVDRYGTDIPELTLPIHVKPYFYHTAPFALLMILVLYGIIYLYLLLRMRYLKQARERLEKAVEERTEELSSANRILRRQNEELASRKILLSPEFSGGEQEEHFMEKVLETLKKTYKDPELDVETFCRAMGMSKTMLNTKMQQTVKQSPAQFIRTFRLSVAKEMLENGTRKNISEIAYDVGFNDPKYFTRCFSKEYGVTPSTAAVKN